jgi:hypothetical protein
MRHPATRKNEELLPAKICLEHESEASALRWHTPTDHSQAFQLQPEVYPFKRPEILTLCDKWMKIH